MPNHRLFATKTSASPQDAGRRARSLRLGWRLLLASVGLALVLGFFVFDDFAPPAESEIRRAAAAVVLTGAYERVDAGLQLLHAGKVPRLYVSGVNGNAGITPKGFVPLFGPRNPAIIGLQELVDCCVEWGELADNTLQNARDVECWAARRRVEGPLLLVTGRTHMARARASLRSALPGREILAYPVEEAESDEGELRYRAIQYSKFLLTLVLAPLQRVIPSPALLGPFAGGCPERL
jgi:uncharacterized SAM-binding protein YcdF (DUF218 family)